MCNKVCTNKKKDVPLPLEPIGTIGFHGWQSSGTISYHRYYATVVENGKAVKKVLPIYVKE